MKSIRLFFTGLLHLLLHLFSRRISAPPAAEPKSRSVQAEPHVPSVPPKDGGHWLDHIVAWAAVAALLMSILSLYIALSTHYSSRENFSYETIKEARKSLPPRGLQAVRHLQLLSPAQLKLAINKKAYTLENEEQLQTLLDYLEDEDDKKFENPSEIAPHTVKGDDVWSLATDGLNYISCFEDALIPWENNSGDRDIFHQEFGPAFLEWKELVPFIHKLRTAWGDSTGTIYLRIETFIKEHKSALTTKTSSP